MPELPEIEISRQRLDPKILGRPVREMAILDEGILDGTDPDTLRQGLAGAVFTGIARFGHFLLLEVDESAVLLLSLSPSAAIEQVRPHEEPPRGTRLGMRFSDSGGLAVVDPRNQSWLAFISDESTVPDLGTFGPDALNGRLVPEQWWQALHARRAQIKGLLLEPDLIAGVGPGIADEILFQAGIRPDRKASDLAREEAERLRVAASATVDKAVRCQARPEQLPNGYLSRALAEGSEACPKCGEALEKRKIQGRTTHFCSSCQQ
ncbi:DNA-formamidopyrimidine glycosylase family protein [Thiohalorhabdus sp.]|uniref:DNA-formamidopyrimidine glycosylase family protein n=1 Tax=Thiohalorhabdus sp. TaxID=3094134 RepID=UPI002FC32D61